MNRSPCRENDRNIRMLRFKRWIAFVDAFYPRER